MARIPQDELERLKREIDLVELVRSRGVELKANGKDLVGLCPFHLESTPSFRVNPEKGVFHCFGCGAKGSVIDFVMRFEGVTFRHAVEILRAGRPLSPAPPSDRPLPKRSSVVKLDEVVTDDAGDAELRTQVAAYYHETLKRSPEAVDYLEKRGLDPEALVDRFHLGYSNRTLGYHLPQKCYKNGKAIRGRLAELGIIKTTGHELLRGSLVVPVFDAAGQVVQMYGRKITRKLRAGTPKHLYLPGPRRGIFNLKALAESKEIILCEALIDAMTFISAGYPNVTSAYGKNGFTDEMLEAFKAYGTERVLIAYDRDDQSEPAAEALGERLGAEGISCFRVRFPHEMDANEYALKVTPPAQSLGVLLRGAEHMSGPVSGLSVVGSRLSEGSGPREPATRSTGAEERSSSPLAATKDPSTIVKTQEGTGSAAPRIPKPEPAALEPALTPKTDNQQPATNPATDNPQPTTKPAPTTENREPTTPTASPVPPPPAADVPAEIYDHEIIIHIGDRRWRVRGLAKNLSHEQLRINLMVSSGDHYHVDTLELYTSRQRNTFLKQAVAELQVESKTISTDLGQVLMKLEQIQEQRIKAELEPEDTTVKLTEEDRKAALELLKDPQLLDRVSADLEACGLVGEHTNKLVAYLATISRKLEKPLGVMVQSSSAAGKSALMDAVLSFAPPEERVQYSAMTGQSLFYMGETDLKHKVLAIAEEEGAERASYSLKLLQSEGKLSIASAGKDPKTGQQKTYAYHVEGPAAILLTTTAIDVDEELMNRLVVLTVDESREQTEAIHTMQRSDRTLDGLKRRLARGHRRKVHQNAQRLLRPLYVVNPYSTRLTFLANTTRTRRDHLKYHGLIETIALVHQHQREVKNGVIEGKRVDYIEVEISDIAMANLLASDVLGRTLDELPPQTRRLLFLVEEMVNSVCEAKKIEQKHFRFTRRQVREHTGWGNTQLKIHFHRLEEMEYLLVHRGGRGMRFVYELLYDGEGKAGEPFVLGLIDVAKLKGVDSGVYDANRSGSQENRSGQKPNWSAPSRPQVGGVSGGGRGDATAPTKEENPTFGKNRQKHVTRDSEEELVVVVEDASYRKAK